LSNDADFGVIERATKKYDLGLYVPDQWFRTKILQMQQIRRNEPETICQYW